MSDRQLNAMGLMIVFLLHALVLWGLWRHRLIPSAEQAMTLFVNFIAPPSPPESDKPPMLRPVKPHNAEIAQPQQLVAETPLIASTDYVVALPQPVNAIEAPQAPLPKEAVPVTLGAELSVTCPERSAPTYPLVSRRQGEEGNVLLRVELDERGLVVSARIATSSGHSRLDEAALEAIRTWRCSPAKRNGQPVHAIALQPFKFILQGK